MGENLQNLEEQGPSSTICLSWTSRPRTLCGQLLTCVSNKCLKDVPVLHTTRREVPFSWTMGICVENFNVMYFNEITGDQHCFLLVGVTLPLPCWHGFYLICLPDRDIEDPQDCTVQKLWPCGSPLPTCGHLNLSSLKLCNSLELQWLGLCASMQKTRILSLVRVKFPCLPAWQKKKKLLKK